MIRRAPHRHFLASILPKAKRALLCLRPIHSLYMHFHFERRLQHLCVVNSAEAKNLSNQSTSITSFWVMNQKSLWYLHHLWFCLFTVKILMQVLRKHWHLELYRIKWINKLWNSWRIKRCCDVLKYTGTSWNVHVYISILRF